MGAGPQEAPNVERIRLPAGWDPSEVLGLTPVSSVPESRRK